MKEKEVIFLKKEKRLILKITIIILIIVGSGFAINANRDRQIEKYYDETLILLDLDIESEESKELTIEEKDAFKTYRDMREIAYKNKDLKGLKTLFNNITTLRADIDTRKKNERYIAYEKEVETLTLDEDKQDFIDKKKELLNAIKNNNEESEIIDALQELKELHETLDDEIATEAKKVADETINSGGSCYDLTGRARGECFRKEKQDNASEHTGNPCIGLRGRERGECNRNYYGRG